MELAIRIIGEMERLPSAVERIEATDPRRFKEGLLALFRSPLLSPSRFFFLVIGMLDPDFPGLGELFSSEVLAYCSSNSRFRSRAVFFFGRGGLRTDFFAVV